MGRSKLPSFCLNRIATRIRVRSPPPQEKAPLSPKIAGDANPDYQSESVDQKACFNSQNEGEKQKQLAAPLGRRVMVAVDSSSEAKFALQWALTHSVQCHDILVLLDVTRPSKTCDQSGKEMDPSSNELLNAMKKVSKAKRPEIKVELCIAEGKDRGPAIVNEARKQGVSVLVLGQKIRSITWRLLMIWAGNRGNCNTVDYCIQNAPCMTLAVRKNNKRAGGYLITTRRHKDFWLLA